MKADSNALSRKPRPSSSFLASFRRSTTGEALGIDLRGGIGDVRLPEVVRELENEPRPPDAPSIEPRRGAEVSTPSGRHGDRRREEMHGEQLGVEVRDDDEGPIVGRPNGQQPVGVAFR